MELLTSILAYLSTLPYQPIIIVLISVIIIAVFIRNMYEYLEYIHSRKNITLHNVMDYSETLLNNLMADIGNKYKDVIQQKTKRKKLTQADKIEILAFNALMSNSTHEIKHLIKNAVRVNGYYDLYKKTKNISTAESSRQKLNDIYATRSKEVFNIVTSSINVLLPDDFDVLTIIDVETITALWMSIISRHVSEIDKEIIDINKKANSLFNIVSKKIKYSHI